MKTRPAIYTPPAETQIFGGVPSYLGLPVVRDKKELSQYDFAVLGVPWEGGCTIGNFSSCELATKAVRLASVRYSGYLPDYDIDIFDTMTLCDYGDVPTRNGDYAYTFGAIREKYAELLDAGVIPIVFGGDHGIAYPMISTLAERHPGRVGVIHFDAHLDNYPSFGEDDLARCSPFNRLYHDPNIDSTKIVHLGIRGPRNHPQEGREAHMAGATVIPARAVKERGWRASIEKALEIVTKDTDCFYISVCSDVVDAGSNPDGPIDPAGLSTYEMCMMLNACGAAGAASFDYVEIYPRPDGPQLGPHTANYFAIYFMNGVARGRLGISDEIPW